MTPIPYTLYADPFRIWSSFAWKMSEMMLVSMHVISHRSQRMAGNAQSADNRRELGLMAQEKAAVAIESAQTMAFSSMMLSQQLCAAAFKQMLAGTVAIMSVSASRTPAQSVTRQLKLVRSTMARSAVTTAQLSGSTARIAHRGLKPIHSRATANARRLGKRK